MHGQFHLWPSQLACFSGRLLWSQVGIFLLEHLSQERANDSRLFIDSHSHHITLHCQYVCWMRTRTHSPLTHRRVSAHWLPSHRKDLGSQSKHPLTLRLTPLLIWGEFHVDESSFWNASPVSYAPRAALSLVLLSAKKKNSVKISVGKKILLVQD